MIYTAGYAGHTIEALQSAAQREYTFVLDIRYSRRSRMWQWQGEELEKALGGRYRWVFSLGNKRYKDGPPIELNNPVSGLMTVGRLAAERSVILLCGCKLPEGCHRTVVADLLRADGYEVEELKW